jgi:DNA-binding NtrC family response regulator
MRKPRVLLIDDHENYLNRMEEILLRSGIRAGSLVYSNDPIIQLNRYDVVVIDLGVCSKSGIYDVPDNIRKNNPALKIIGQTAIRHLHNEQMIDEARPHFDRIVSKLNEEGLPLTIFDLIES